MTPNLFQLGKFTLHSKATSAWKIDCDALTNADINTLAVMLSEILPGFGSVEGVPSGGLRLANALAPLATSGRVLIVDDVLTTGRSMEAQRAGRDAIGAVIFARNACPSWVVPLFLMNQQTTFEQWWCDYRIKNGLSVASKMREAARCAWEAVASQNVPFYVLNALLATKVHIGELRDAWQRGVIDERDSGGGTRSNRNVDIDVAVRNAIDLLMPP